MFACLNVKADIVRLLLAFGALPDIRVQHFYRDCNTHLTERVSYLSQDKFGHDAMHYAAEMAMPEAIEMIGNARYAPMMSSSFVSLHCN